MNKSQKILAGVLMPSIVIGSAGYRHQSTKDRC